ncbi:hypothetical protein PHYBOEH_002555 [Phytophthora boehmeriae]|uniref:BZIP domain-containing protein n=1 Tax=Phytophthora boehmeriae TaxID=109152 RepID=A0A8T1WQS0_9STRA|nr:hypothetical protein PHYBOEH_002555 [Phytophthora boehmeriae]
MSDQPEFLAKSFLDKYDMTAARTNAPYPLPESDDHNILIVSCHHLVQETEALLASFKTSTPDSNTGPEDTSQGKNGAQEGADQGKTGGWRIPAQRQDRERQERNAQAAQRRRIKYRQKVKNERLALKQQEVELSAVLNELVTRQLEIRKRESESLTFSVWKSIATRQMERRCEAEEEQKRLRAEIVSRARKIHLMNNMLLATSATNQPERLTLGETLGKDIDGSTVLKTYLRELDALYAQTDKMRRGIEFKLSPSMEYNLSWRKEQGVEFLESADATIVPFSFERTAVAVSTMMFTVLDGWHYYDNVEDPENTCAVRYRGSHKFGANKVVDLVVYSVLRRYKEAGRIVFIWRSLTEGQGEFDGIHCDETTWCVVRPCDATDSSDHVRGSRRSRGSATILEFYGRLVPIGIGGQEKIKEFVKAVSKAGEEDTKEATMMLDRLLLDGP